MEITEYNKNVDELRDEMCGLLLQCTDIDIEIRNTNLKYNPMKDLLDDCLVIFEKKARGKSISSQLLIKIMDTYLKKHYPSNNKNKITIEHKFFFRLFLNNIAYNIKDVSMVKKCTLYFLGCLRASSDNIFHELFLTPLYPIIDYTQYIFNSFKKLVTEKLFFDNYKFSDSGIALHAICTINILIETHHICAATGSYIIDLLV